MATQKIPHVVVVGGGITGLAAAYRLQEISREREFPLRFTLLEASDRFGGTLATEKRDGFLLELGPDSFISEKPWALALCRRIGLESKLIGTQDQHRATFVVHNGKLEPLPEGFMLMAPTRVGPLVRSQLFSWPGKLRMALDLVLPRAAEREDESLGSFVRRRFGREALERVAQPLIGGIYTADPELLSLAATIPRFLQMEREHRSVIYAMWQVSRKKPQEAKDVSGARWSLFVTLHDGMQTMVETLVGRLTHGTLCRGTAAETMRQENGRWQIICQSGESLEADGVILATPAFHTTQLVRETDASLAEQLGSISYSSAATVNLAFRRDQIPHPLNGFGFVVPHRENRRIIAGTFSSVKYVGRAPEGHVLLRAFVGGVLQAGLFDRKDDEIEQLVREELRQLLGITTPPLFVRIARYPRSMPQYLVGHLKLVDTIEKGVAKHPGLAVAGSAYRGVGIADCVRSGEAAAEVVLESLTKRREKEEFSSP